MSAPTFVAWASEQLARQGKHLSPAQAIACAVVYDGAEPLDFASRPETAILFGDVERLPPGARRTVVASIGARSGKSFLLGALRSAYCALFFPLDPAKIAAGEQPCALIMATDMRLGRHVLRYVEGLALPNTKVLKDCIEVARPDGFVVRIEVLPASVGGVAGRGRWFVSAFCDEFAFFRDKDSGLVNDSDCHEAILTRLLPGAQVTLSSTPWAKIGAHYSLFHDNRTNPKDAIALFAPTLCWRPDDLQLAADIESIRQRSPDVAAREYFCEWLSVAESAYFDPDVLDVTLSREPPAACTSYYAGIDLSNVRDHSALVIIGQGDAGVALIGVHVWKPERGVPLRFKEMIPEMCREVRAWGISRVYADQYEINVAREHCTEGVEIEPIPAGAGGKLECFARLREMLPAMAVCERDAWIVDQLKAVKSSPLPGGGQQITLRRTAYGGHSDAVSALVAAAYQLHPVDPSLAAAERSEAFATTLLQNMPALARALNPAGCGHPWERQYLHELMGGQPPCAPLLNGRLFAR